MNRAFWGGAVSIACAVSLAAPTSCSDSGKSGPTPGAAGSSGAGPAGPLTIGVIQSLTGTDASLGTSLRDATKVAEAHINAFGGVLGRQIKFDVRDDATDNAQTVGLANEFIAAAGPGALGATTSATTMAIHQLFFDAHMLLISAGATTTGLSAAQPEHDRYFFRTVPSGKLHGKALAKLAFTGPPASIHPGVATGCRKMFSVYVDNDYGKPFAEQLKQSFEARGGTVLTPVAPIPKDVKASYETEAGLVIQARPECVSLIAYLDAGIQFLRDLHKAQVADTSYDWSNVLIYAGNTFNTLDFITKGRTNPSDPNSPTVAEGVLGTNLDTAPDTPQFSEFRNLYTAMFPLPEGQPPPRNTANQFDAAMLLALALQQAGGFDDRVKLRDALYAVSKGGTAYGPLQFGEALSGIKLGQDIDYAGASGMVDFDDFGDVESDFIVWAVQSAAMVTAERMKAQELDQ